MNSFYSFSLSFCSFSSACQSHPNYQVISHHSFVFPNHAKSSISLPIDNSSSTVSITSQIEWTPNTKEGIRYDTTLHSPCHIWHLVTLVMVHDLFGSRMEYWWYGISSFIDFFNWHHWHIAVSKVVECVFRQLEFFQNLWSEEWGKGGMSERKMVRNDKKKSPLRLVVSLEVRSNGWIEERREFLRLRMERVYKPLFSLLDRLTIYCTWHCKIAIQFTSFLTFFCPCNGIAEQRVLIVITAGGIWGRWMIRERMR